ncbi:Plant self-incompatibility protein S1 family [Euphorbia peplus]|nr:Plant self-incompatibility protein S1 family [Euphorbia peplus]
MKKLWVVTIIMMLMVMIDGSDGTTIIPTDRKFVRITNHLSEKDQTELFIHCKSGNDDLGIHILQYAQYYEFTFKPYANTLFFCFFKWPGISHWFDIYIDSRDHEECSFCSWSIVPTGPCRFNETTNVFDICSKWNPKSTSFSFV